MYLTCLTEFPYIIYTQNNARMEPGAFIGEQFMYPQIERGD